MKYGLFFFVIVMAVSVRVDGAVGYGDSWPPKPLNTVPPVFSDLTATPDRTKAGDIVTLSFTVSKELETDPSVFINGNVASIMSDKSASAFTCLYVVLDTDPIGPAFIEISGQDPLGNAGVLSAGNVLEIIQAPAALSLHAWPLAALLLAVSGLIVLSSRRLKRKAILPFLALALTATAIAQVPEVSNVSFEQGPAPAGGTRVIVTYDLVAPGGAPCAVYLALSKNSDDAFLSPVASYSGAIAHVETGTGHEIQWQIARDYPNTDLPEARIRVIADNDPTPHTLTYTAGPNGSIAGQAMQSVDHGGDGAPVTAVPNQHYIFLEWSDGVQTETRQETAVTTDLNVTATFAPLGYNSVFLEGASVRIPTVHRTPGAWRVRDDALDVVAEGAFVAGEPYIDAGKLSTGWYRIEFLDEPGVFTTAAVLTPLKAQPSPDTPVAVDIAVSWSAGDDPSVWRNAARAAALAGIRTVRDRIDWRHFQPTAGPLLENLKYDLTAEIQHEYGLDIVQVFHNSPTWTRDHSEDAGRVPPDLRHTYEFCRAIAERFADTVHIWQPWNEGNSPNFGRHAIDELCSHQKAAYWGFKRGNPESLVTWAPLGGINSDGLCHGIRKNGTRPYFDVYALHSYEWPDAYTRVREEALATAAGKPLWVTESDRGIPLDPASPYRDLTYENERRKAQFMAQSIATSLSTGTMRNFHFLLRQYGTDNQFGLLRHDDTPRMSYVALAAAGRFLADAQYLGRVIHEHGEDVHVLAFRARPDGVERDVLVAYTERRVEWNQRGNTTSALNLPSNLKITGVWDYLGRPKGAYRPTEVSGAALFIIMPVGEVNKLALQTLTPAPEVPDESPSPVVLQLRFPVGTRSMVYRLNNWAPEHDRAMNPGTHTLIVSAYNFGDETVTGTVATDDIPDGWLYDPASWNVTVDPMERQDQTVTLTIPEPGPPADEGAWTSFQGNFGASGAPRLAFRAMPKP